MKPGDQAVRPTRKGLMGRGFGSATQLLLRAVGLFPAVRAKVLQVFTTTQLG